MRLEALILCSALLTSAQDAIVVQLQPETTAKIARLYAEKARIEKELNDETERIGEVYSRWGDSVVGHRVDGSTYNLKPRHAFKFSTDFKYIVPDDAKPTTSTGVVMGWGNCLTVNPALSSPIINNCGCLVNTICSC